MSLYLVDTNWVIDALHAEPVAVQTLADLTDDGLAISLITYAELYEGAYYARSPNGSCWDSDVPEKEGIASADDGDC